MFFFPSFLNDEAHKVLKMKFLIFRPSTLKTCCNIHEPTRRLKVEGDSLWGKFPGISVSEFVVFRVFYSPLGESRVSQTPAKGQSLFLSQTVVCVCRVCVRVTKRKVIVGTSPLSKLPLALCSSLQPDLFIPRLKRSHFLLASASSHCSKVLE